MKLCFKVDRACGYSKQLIINTELKMYSIGYCLASPFDTLIKLATQKEIEKLAQELKAKGYTREGE